MPINISIKEDHVKDLIEFYSQKQKELKARIAALEKEAKEVMGIIVQLKQSQKRSGENFQSNELSIEEVYSDSWSWVKKISYAIAQIGKPSTLNEISAFLDQLDPNAKGSSISATLSQKSGDFIEKRDFIRTKNANGDWVYEVWKEDFLVPQQTVIDGLLGFKITGDDLPF